MDTSHESPRRSWPAPWEANEASGSANQAVAGPNEAIESSEPDLSSRSEASEAPVGDDSDGDERGVGLPTMADLDGLSADLDAIDAILARMDATGVST